jgi:hypothetical protein
MCEAQLKHMLLKFLQNINLLGHSTQSARYVVFFGKKLVEL